MNVSLSNNSASVDEDKESNQSGDPDAWEKVSYGDLNLDGMNDPYANKFKNTIIE